MHCTGSLDISTMYTVLSIGIFFFFFSSRRRHTRLQGDWSSDVCSCDLWEDAARKSPGKQRVHFQLAHTYYTNGRCSDAIAQYAEAARVQKPDYGLLVDWGLAYDCADQPDRAVAKLREAAALVPTAHVYS